jgi:peptidoglycan/xylan/chitin deacetylase (PgdA/CDA1 family)
VSLRHWLGSRVLKSSAALHGTALLGTALSPQHWPIGLAAIAANHLFLGTATLIPKNPLFGRNITRLPAPAMARQEICLTFDDGPHPVYTPQVLDMLDGANAKASFFCVAKHAEQNQSLLRDIVARGHSVENHSFRHPHLFSLYGPKRIQREIADAQKLLSDITGVVPRFFRPPVGFANPFVAPVLAEMGLVQATWTRRGFDTQDSHLPRVLNRFGKRLCAGDILLLHDANSALVQNKEMSRPLILSLLPAILQLSWADQLRCVTLPQAFYGD